MADRNPNYLQWSADVGAIETTYTDDTTDNILQRAMGVKNAGVKYATDVGIAIKDYDVNTAAAREEYISSLMTIAKSIGDKFLDAQRDKEIALADAELQKQLTGNESTYSSAVQAANDAYNNTTSAEASRKSQEQTARSTMITKLSNELKDKEADIAAAERTYDQTVASLDAQYGSESSNGDTGVEGATRRSAIKTRDAQYYAARDTSWANTLSGSTTLGTSPWTVKAIAAANAQAASSTSRASAQAAHDAAMLDAIEDWQLSRNESLTDLLFTEGQSRETYNVATSNVYANWQNGVGNLVMEEPSGTYYRGPVSRHKGATTNSRENVLQYVRFPGDENGDEKGASTNSVGSQSGLPNSLPTPTAVTVMVDLPKFIIPPIRMTKEEYEQFVSGLKNGEIALEEISLPVEGMHPKMIQFVGENRELYLAFTRQYGFAYQHKLNALFKMGFDVHVGGRHVMNWASGNIEMTNIYVDTSTFFVPSYHETTAERMKDIIDFIATKHEGVKSPVLRAGDFAVWYNPNQTMIQSGSLVDTNVYNLATQVAEDAATELILQVSGTKLAALSGGAAMQGGGAAMHGGGAAMHGGAEAGSVGLAAIMWWFRNRRAAATWGVVPAMRYGDEATGVIVNGQYILNPTAKNLATLLTNTGKIGSKQMSGQFMYVIDDTGNIIIGTRAKSFTSTPMPHPTLIGGADPRVRAAGILDIRGGRIYSVDDASGHFKPGTGALKAAEEAFRRILPASAFHKNFQGFLSWNR